MSSVRGLTWLRAAQKAMRFIDVNARYITPTGRGTDEALCGAVIAALCAVSVRSAWTAHEDNAGPLCGRRGALALVLGHGVILVMPLPRA